MRAIVRTADVTRVRAEDLDAVGDAILSALASRRDSVPIADADELRAHERITARIHEQVASLPSRFGQFFPDETALIAALRERRADLLDELDAVGDRAEMSVTLAWREPPEHTPTTDLATGRAFLVAKAARQSEHRDAEQVVARLVDQLAMDQAVIRHRICPREGVAAIVAVLIARDGAEMLRTEVHSFEERSRDVTARVYGPLPPYSFAS